MAAAGGCCGQAPRTPRPREGSRLVLRPVRHGLVFNWVLLSVLLVIGTAVWVGGVIAQALSREIDRAADRRLADGAVFFGSALEDTRADLLEVAGWLTRDTNVLTLI